MKNLSEALLALVLIAVPLGLLSYIFASTVNEFFGERVYVIVIFSLGLFLLILEVIKKNKRKKNE